ncbi:hypothetical protein MAX89_26395, partial [Escherichia coli]
MMYSGATIGAESVEYDPTFLMGGNASSIDVSRYSDGNPTLPGVYDVSIYVNEQPVANLEIPFIAIPDKKNAQACITLKNLLQLHIKTPPADEENTILLPRDETLGNCLDLSLAIPKSSVNYDPSEQRLDINVPQAWVMKNYQN